MSLFVINPLGIIFKLFFTHKAKTFVYLVFLRKMRCSLFRVLFFQSRNMSTFNLVHCYYAAFCLFQISELPYGWERATNAENQIYFIE